jgi:hypothetical protein
MHQRQGGHTSKVHKSSTSGEQTSDLHSFTRDISTQRGTLWFLFGLQIKTIQLGGVHLMAAETYGIYS